MPRVAQATSPRLRDDLQFELVESQGMGRLLVQDPRSGRIFAFTRLQHDLLLRMDGARSLEQIRDAFLHDHPGLHLTNEALEGFVSRLSRSGLLEGGEAAPRPRSALHRRLFYYRTPPRRSDAIFRAALPVARLFYSVPGAALTVLFTLTVTHWAFFSGTEIASYAARLARPSTLPAFLAAVLIAGAFHELGHGATSAYFGQMPRGLGLLVMYGMPGFYCDVTNAWSLPGRMQRVAVSLAGVAWQFVAGCAAFVAWKALEPDTFAGAVCFMVAALSGLSLLANLNPFLPLDGYFALMDWWEMPNLRRKSLRYFRERMAHLFLGQVPSVQASGRQGRIYLWFGALSALFALLAGGLLIVRAGTWLVGHWRGTGALILGGVAMASIFSWFRARETTPRDGETGASPRRMRPTPAGVLTLAGLAVFFGWFFFGEYPMRIASPCTLEAVSRAAVRPEIEGVLQEIRFEEGQPIRAGELFAVLESTELQQSRRQVDQRAAAIHAAGNAVESAVPLLRAENIRDVLEADQDARDAETRLQDLRQSFPVRQSEAEKKVQEARAELEAAHQVAERLREDERRMVDGRWTPEAQVIVDRLERTRTQTALAQREMQRAAFLVSEGALQRQKLDQAEAEWKALQREEAALLSEIEAIRKRTSEAREDAEATVRSRRAAYDAAVEAQRLVAEETRPEKLSAADAEAAARRRIASVTRELRVAEGVKRSEAAARRMEVLPLQTEGAKLDDRIRRTRVIAPASGIVSTPRLQEKRGRRFLKGETIAWIDQARVLTARIFVDEKEIGYVRKGQPVGIRVNAFADRTFEGRVTDVSPRASGGGARASYEVRLTIPNPHMELLPGVTGYAKVECGKRKVYEVALRRLWRYWRTEVWTWY